MKKSRIALFALFSLMTVAVSPFIGMQNIPLSALFGNADPGAMSIFWDIRVPRVLLGWLTGATLSVCGLIFQALFRNSLASPDMLGVSSGAALGAVIYIRTGIALSFLGQISGISLSAFAGALAATAAIYAAGSARRGGMSDATLLLAGIAISFLCGSLNMILQYSGGYSDSFRMMRWSMGGLQTVGFMPVLGALPGAVVITAIAFAAGPELNLAVCGEEMAASRGVSVAKLRKRLFIAVSAAVGINVAICGPIGFVGLMVPHICRRFLGSENRQLSVASPLFGGAFLVICDTAARTVWAPTEIPAGILTSCAGSIFFLWLLVRSKD
jgi:iron complex transport system permease protein